MTTARDRLAAALERYHDVWPDAAEYGQQWEREADAILAADPALAEAIELGLAFREAEEALPEGARIAEIWQSDVDWSVLAETAEADGVRDEAGLATGPTPTAALLALAAALRERKEAK